MAGWQQLFELPSIANPIEQGLKQVTDLPVEELSEPSIANPIEQGLKQCVLIGVIGHRFPSIANPIEQGLKHLAHMRVSFKLIYLR